MRYSVLKCDINGTYEDDASIKPVESVLQILLGSLPSHLRTQLEHKEWEECEIHPLEDIIIPLTAIVLDEAEDYDVGEDRQQTDKLEGRGADEPVEEQVEAIVSGTDIHLGMVQIALNLGF